MKILTTQEKDVFKTSARLLFIMIVILSIAWTFI